MKGIHATLILTLAWGLAPFPLAAQPIETKPAELPGFGSRFDAFQFLWANPLSNDRTVTLRSLDDFRHRQHNESSAWTLLLLGNGPSLLELGIDASTFVREGGSLLVATDRSMTLSLGSPPSLSIVAGPIRASLDSSSYQGRPSCPLVTEFRRPHALLTDIQQIALNLPGFFARNGSKEWGISYLPVASNVVPNARAWLTAGELDRGRFVASADQSVFSNEMIQEADNVRLADNTVRWLLETKPAQSNLVCLVDGRELTRLVDERFITGDWQKRPPTSELLNELLRGLQEEDVPNAIAREAQASISSFHPWIVRQIGMIVLGSVMGALLAWRILGAREAGSPLTLPSHTDGWVPGFDRSSIVGLPRADRILDSRQKEMSASDNYRPQLAREARSALNRWFGIDGWSGSMPTPPIRPSTWWKRRRARLRLRTLARFARGDGHEPVSERKFRYWQSEIQRLDSMMRGTNDFGPRPKEPTSES